MNGREREDVDEALVAPRTVDGGVRGQTEERVGHVDVELGDGPGLGDGREEREGHEVPVHVRELHGELGGELAPEGRRVRERDRRAAAGRAELEELVDPGARGLIQGLERGREGLEPLQVARVAGRALGQGLGVGWRGSG